MHRADRLAHELALDDEIAEGDAEGAAAVLSNTGAQVAATHVRCLKHTMTRSIPQFGCDVPPT